MEKELNKLKKDFASKSEQLLNLYEELEDCSELEGVMGVYNTLILALNKEIKWVEELLCK